MVQDPLRNACRYEDGKWIEDDLSLDEKVDLYNEDKGRFTFYPWGVFVSAYSRRHLLYAVRELEDDFAYSDTDSAKFLNGRLHKEWFDRYNQAVANFIWRNLEEMKIDPNLSAPNGKQLGAWEYEGTYEMFKTIGQKRYLGLMNGELKATVSGVNSDGITTFLQKCSLNPFEDFDEDLEVPAEYAKRTFSYLIKTRRNGIIKDRDGFNFEYDEPSGTYLEAGRYHMTLTEVETYGMTTTDKL